MIGSVNKGNRHFVLQIFQNFWKKMTQKVETWTVLENVYDRTTER
jgi:hypothetical protein